MRDLLLLPVVVVILAACATTEAPEDPRPVSRPPSEPYPDGTPDDVREYLTRVYGQIQPWWHVAMKKARSSYKKKHCVNDRSLEAVVALHFDGDRRVLERSSGCKLFDETALSVFSWVKKLPPRPESMDKTPGRLVLRWRFFRDDRRCEPAFASLEVQAYAPGERMARALSARDWVEARQVLTGHRSEAVLRVLTEAALSSPEPRIRRAALGVASSERVAQALRSDRSAATWNHGVQVLESRQAGALLVQLLGEVATAKKGQDAPRIKRIVDALGRLKSGIPDQTVVALIANPEQSVSLGALALTRDPRVLARARPAWKGNAGMTAALAVRWCSLVEDKAAERAVKASLDSPGRTVALKALERFPLAGLTGEVGALVRSAQVSADDRVLGIRVLARIPDGSLTSLRVALTAREPAVQIAAAEALGNSRSGRTPSTYRLSHVARRSSGDVAAACLAAQACLGYQPFMKEVLRRMRRLPEERQKAKVVAGLWGYGAKAVPDLARIARGSGGAPKQAALSCLRRIDAPEARAALDKLGGVRRDEPTAPVEPAGPFEQLLLDAANP